MCHTVERKSEHKTATGLCCNSWSFMFLSEFGYYHAIQLYATTTDYLHHHTVQVDIIMQMNVFAPSGQKYPKYNDCCLNCM